MVDGAQATVRTRIITKQGTEVPVDYRMFQRDGRWRVFDVNIEGVSLVGNYRTQFNAIIVRSPYQDLVTKLKAKQDESAGSKETGRHRGESPRRRGAFHLRCLQPLVSVSERCGILW